VAAGCVDDVAGDPPGGVGGEEHSDGADVFRYADRPRGIWLAIGLSPPLLVKPRARVPSVLVAVGAITLTRMRLGASSLAITRDTDVSALLVAV
jgi:hypothetical protein